MLTPTVEHPLIRQRTDDAVPSRTGDWPASCGPRTHRGRTLMLYRSLIGAIAVAAALMLTPASAQVFDPAKYPDLSGQWRRVASGPPRYDTTKGYGRAQQPPLTEEYRLIHEQSLADQAEGGQGLYRTSARCLPMGMPWQMYGLFPLEFVITPSTTYVLAEIMTQQPRRIYTDGR